jgi:hypothetical protein
MSTFAELHTGPPAAVAAERMGPDFCAGARGRRLPSDWDHRFRSRVEPGPTRRRTVDPPRQPPARGLWRLRLRLATTVVCAKSSPQAAAAIRDGVEPPPAIAYDALQSEPSHHR